MYDLIILGGGPAGLTSAIYASRGGLKTLIIETKGLGGQAALTPDVENYPGVERTDGFSLTFTMLNQAQSFGAEIVYDQLLSVDLLGEIKKIRTATSGDYEAKAIVIASGASAKKLGTPRESDLIGKGVSYCATCDGGFFKGKPVAVIGNGNIAVQDALYLQNFASKVYVICHKPTLSAAKPLLDKLSASKIEVYLDAKVQEFIGEPLTAINVKHGDDKMQLQVNGAFIAIGQSPASATFKEVNTDEDGYIITDEEMRTNVDGVFAAGDIRHKSLRQIVTACADGAIAAENAIKFLK